ncbi:unnamed protein product [Chondrus crispus]|uniref:Uncharacterized protein n=1 Tax=Chondrus crispus TaxID=2769 RepID=R7QUG6_CHOCR|nr:unnamed protein product [Chondrus crispus]CDF41328.1 unnamed protein product [Chondrus crispus]|eukprot:XP_005711622.1 unnamed protein product [Chondrus crispus]
MWGEDLAVASERDGTYRRGGPTGREVLHARDGRGTCAHACGDTCPRSDTVIWWEARHWSDRYSHITTTHLWPRAAAFAILVPPQSPFPDTRHRSSIPPPPFAFRITTTWTATPNTSLQPTPPNLPPRSPVLYKPSYTHLSLHSLPHNFPLRRTRSLPSSTLPLSRTSLVYRRFPSYASLLPSPSPPHPASEHSYPPLTHHARPAPPSPCGPPRPLPPRPRHAPPPR